MTNERYEFFQDQASKSITAKSAHAKYKRQNTLNNYTNAEARKMNSEVRTYNLGIPMKWKDFKLMPEEHQRTYLQKLFDNGVSVPAMADMFGTSTSTIKVAKNALHVVSSCSAGAHMTKKASEWWNGFINGFADSVSGVVAEEEPAPTFNIRNIVVSWDDFLKLSVSQQEAYLQVIIDEFHVGLVTISECLFGCSGNTLPNYVARKKLNVRLTGERGQRAVAAKKRFVEALGLEAPAKDKSTVEKQEPVTTSSDDSHKSFEEEKEFNNSTLKRAELWFDRFDFEFLRMIAYQFNGRKIRIHIDIQEEE